MLAPAGQLEWIFLASSCGPIFVSPSDPFVKVYLLQNGKKISKKKTSIKKDERSPIFNEAMIFSVPASALQVSTAQRQK